jgi:hypothetical protein
VIFLNIAGQAIKNLRVQSLMNQAFSVPKDQLPRFHRGETSNSTCPASKTAEDGSFNLRAPFQTPLDNRAGDGIPAPGGGRFPFLNIIKGAAGQTEAASIALGNLLIGQFV